MMEQAKKFLHSSFLFTEAEDLKVTKECDVTLRIQLTLQV